MAEARAIELKSEGNKCFHDGDYVGAEALYTKAIMIDPSNPLLYTNRAMSRLKLHLYERVLSDCSASLSILPVNMKAHYYRAQAQLEQGQMADALESAKSAYEFCKTGDKKWERDLASVGGLVLRCKKVVWEAKEMDRLADRGRVLGDALKGLEDRKTDELKRIGGIREAGQCDAAEETRRVNEVLRREEADKEVVRRAFGRDAEADGVAKPRVVPDWAIDDITFAFMLDPVVTKTGQSYERASIMEHLRRSPTDPLTREPLRVEDLRPNIALKAACDEFLKENGWAVDW